jgi:hypothetical protein
MRELLDFINERAHRAASCPAMTPCAGEDDGGPWYAVLYVHDDGFNDPGVVVDWFAERGATVERIDHVLHDAFNGDRAGRADDGTRQWIVTFVPPAVSRETSPECGA